MSLCFLCDTKLYGERTRVCSSITPHSNVPYPEKIVELLGDEFVVICTPTDHMCKKCTSLLIHMDKLENDLKLVKNAILSFIQKKYGLLPPDQAVKDVEIVNGHLKADEIQEQEQKKVPNLVTVRDTAAAAAAAATAAATVTTAAIVTPIQTPLKLLRPTQQQQHKQPQQRPQQQQQSQQDGASKLKIYKCGFCTFQSKDLGHVRFHMRTHTNRKEPEKPIVNQVAVKAPTAALIPSQKRRLYRCQVCSKSFDSRINCLDHIQKDHNQPTASTSNGRKQTEDSCPVTTTVTKPEPSTSKENNHHEESSMDIDNDQQDNNKGIIDTDMMLNDNVPPAVVSADTEPEEETKNIGEGIENSQEEKTEKPVKLVPETKVETKEEVKEEQDVEDECKQEVIDPPDSIQMDIDEETANVENKTGDLDIESMLAAIHNDAPTSSGDA